MSHEVYEFISRQNDDPIVERKTCTVSGQPFAIFQSDLDFYKKISPTFSGQKFQIPTPTLCPEERQRRRLMWRNERKLYRRKCDATGESIISYISPDKTYPVYKREVRFSDVFNPLDYGIDFDFTKTFAENFKILLNTVPRYSVQQQDPMQNSDYCNCASNCKNCYYIFDSDFNEDSLFSNVLRRSRRCVDCSFCDTCDGCYECISCRECYQLLASQYCIGCSNCIRCYDCTKCSFCYGCHGLQNKTYCIYNKQYTKEEYFAQLQNIKPSDAIEYIIPGMRLVQTEKTMGNNCFNTKESIWYDLNNTENLRYCDLVTNADTCMDISTIWEELSKSYEWVGVGLASNEVYFSSVVVLNSHHVYYSYLCYPNVSDCFGCIGMKHNSYCVFNKQYTKEEYELLVPKIIAHMQETAERGEFFYPSLSPFGYNETIANEYLPMIENEAKSRWYPRQDNNYDPVIPSWTKVIDRSQYESIPEDDETILRSIFLCTVSKRPYRIIKQELDFYRKNNIAIPRRHPDIRHEQRMKLRPWRTLYLRNCDKTGEQILSVYPPEYTGKVYSEKVYQSEIYS